MPVSGLPASQKLKTKSAEAGSSGSRTRPKAVQLVTPTSTTATTATPAEITATTATAAETTAAA
jgi:hypothetical protein